MENKVIPVLQAETITTYRNIATGETVKERSEWEAKGYKNEDMAQDVKVIMPALDLFSKNG